MPRRPLNLAIACFVLILGTLLGVILVATDASAAKKALVVGIGRYTNVPPLDGPADDANAIYDDLIKFGYNSTLLLDDDVTSNNFNIAWSNFLDDVDEGDDVVIYYSGHGVEIGGTNYIVPMDVPSPDRLGTERALAGALIPMPKLIDDLSERHARATIWILDACRDNPFKVSQAGETKAIGASAGLVIASAPTGTFVFYAAGLRETALPRIKGDSSKNSLYTRFFLETLDNMPGSPVNEIAVAVREKVRVKAMPHQQRPAYYDGLDGLWCFQDCSSRTIAVALNTAAQSIEVKGITVEKGLETGAGTAIAALSADQQASLQDEKTTNAVFLGRRSLSSGCKEDGGGNDRYPFGCDFLKKIVAKNYVSILKRDVTPLTATNIRRGPPIPDLAGMLKYQCVVGTLKPADTVVLSSITEAHEGDETYYWGSVQGRARDCDGSVIPEAATPSGSVNEGIDDPRLKTLTDKLVSDDTTTRRQARNELGKYIAGAGDPTVEQLTSGIADKSYRYQLGVAVALTQRKTPLPDSAKKDVESLVSSTRDETLLSVTRKIDF
ncbi:caspase family protein [Mesorhizobium dulcispinae]|uniref:caspase family protein n=1 Tax=Mesorhizobium dulcispinae TaxID=3072316 RepID=UPI002A23A884|nr:caspase family protein [Mesorhizobium sp. VK23D]MDX8521145.1 caspase family protein [Mesorhizobium sp. VK23D]